MSFSFLKKCFSGSTLISLSVFFVVSMPVVKAEGALSEEVLADLIKPSVVRIAEQVTGTALIPAVKVDIRARTVEAIPDRFTDVLVNEYLSGTGFIIHPDGYIATNAHVVSLETIKVALASESALSAIFENALLLSDQEMEEFLASEDSESFSREIIKFIVEHGEFDLKNKLAVLRPGSEGMSIEDLITTGFPATTVSIHEEFIDDDQDVALVKIEEEHLPALSLGRSEDLSVGSKVFIFGFPSTAEINERDPSEATFTRGVVSAIKQSDGAYKVFQTDAKVSQGSSGGPLFNDRGEILGMVTFQTDELSRSAGDNFAFALPVEVVKQQALEARVLPEEGVYGQNFREGFSAFLEKHCDTALTFFDETKKTHSAFLTDRHVFSYAEKCRTWQDAGQSRDTYWQEFRDDVSTLGSPMLYVIGGSLVSFGVLGGMMLWLLRQLHREEREIDLLEHRLRAEERELRRHERRASDGFPPALRPRGTHEKKL